jgi:hypothetical protein
MRQTVQISDRFLKQNIMLGIYFQIPRAIAGIFKVFHWSNQKKTDTEKNQRPP